MNRGDELRSKIQGNAVAILAVNQIQESRENKTGYIERPHHNHAYILKSLKHVEEVKVLRKIYGNSFLLISSNISKEKRIRLLETKLKSMEKSSHYAEKLINRDDHDEKKKLGQAVRETFPESDVFIDATKREDIQIQIDRFIDLIFGYSFHTPRKEEYGMFHAYASSLRSASLSRQVGAAILDKKGNIISTGTNEVPKAGGGTYDDEDPNDSREFIHGYDSNQQEKLDMLKDIFTRLKKVGWLSDKHNQKNALELVDDALKSNELKNMNFMDLTEYGREVHAEMDALVSAARGNVSVNDCFLYCTTFPCHICAKHIVSSGIDMVVFIEPYPKSHASDLFEDSINVGDKKGDKVHFKPYFGISPRRYTDLFEMVKRKDDKTGKKIDWVASQAEPRYWESKEFAKDETTGIADLVKLMKQKNITIEGI